jgi:hypothetical protein
MMPKETTREEYLLFRKNVLHLARHIQLDFSMATVHHLGSTYRYLYITGHGARQEGLIREAINLFAHGEGHVRFYTSHGGEGKPRMSIKLPSHLFKKKEQNT